MNAASSIINSDNASERPADSFDAIALICEPFVNLIDNLFISSVEVFNHCGNPSYITLTLVTRFFAVSLPVAITKMFLSL